MDYHIKQLPEDFLVEEIPEAIPGKEGLYSYFLMEKKNCNTLAAIKAISRKLGINLKRIGWAGNKDKNAVTRQLISVQNADSAAIRKLFLENIGLSYIGKGSQRIYLGNLLGNKFTITIRNLGSIDYEKIMQNCETLKQNDFLVPNYFDEQRFGMQNLEIGKALLSRDFKLASEKIYRNNTGNAIEALRKVHSSVLAMFMHAYQSLLFNEMLSEYIKSRCSSFAISPYSQGIFYFPRKKIENAKIPLVGFGTELADSKISEVATAVMKKHSITQRDFIIKQLPALTIEGDLRDAFTEVRNLEVSRPEDDELNNGMKKCTVNFSLGKGSYATIVVKALTC
jgi:tRNA pseudouridine13 synthase